MKILPIITSVFMLFLLTGCVAYDDSLPQSTSGISSFNMPGAGADGTADHFRDPEFDQNSNSPILCPASMLHDLTFEHDLAYSDPFSQNYPDQIRLPHFIQYTGDELYYLSYEETPFAGFENSAQTPEIIYNKVYKYDLISKQKESLGNVFFDGIGSDEYFISNGYLYYFPASIDKTDVVLKIRRLSLDTQEYEDILTVRNESINVSFGQTDSGMIVFLLNITEENRNRQIILRDDGQNEPCIIYDSEADGPSTSAFMTLSVHRNSIFLLNAPIENENISITEMDMEGKIQNTIVLPESEQYAEPDYFANKLYLCGEYIFIKWYYCGEDLPYFTAWRMTGEEIRTLDIPQNAPCYLLTPEAIDGQFLLFSTFPDEMDYSHNSYTSHFYVFDMLENRFIGLHLPFEDAVIFNEMVCNESGDLVMNIVEKDSDSSDHCERIIQIKFRSIKEII